jgi:hypothetical protein
MTDQRRNRRQPQQQFPPVDLAHIRGHRVRSLLVYCTDIVCNHSVTWNVDHLPDDTVIVSLEPRMVCTRCERRGADIRPNWGERGVEPGWGGAHSGHDYSQRPHRRRN